MTAVPGRKDRMIAAAKRQLSDMALFGGSPAFAQPLHVGRPNIGDRARLMERLNDLLDRRWLTNAGPYVQRFEATLAELLEVRNAIAVCNATVGLEIAIRAVGMTGEVIVPSFTFVATAHALQWQQITPVFCDIDAETHNIDPTAVEELIGPRTTGIIATHLWGRPAPIHQLTRLAHEHGLRLIFDSAHAFACSYQGEPLGRFGDAEVFSFHATKFVTSNEGGSISTEDDELARRVRLMKNFGFVGYDAVDHIGTNGKMSEMAAAMGLTSLESMAAFVETNERNYQQYRRLLYDLRGVRLIEYNERERCNYQYVVLEIDPDSAGVDRDLLLQALQAENVLARRYFFPGCHRMEPYRSLYPEVAARLPVTERVAARVLSLPTGTAVDPTDIGVVCDMLRLLLADPDATRAAHAAAQPR